MFTDIVFMILFQYQSCFPSLMFSFTPPDLNCKFWSVPSCFRCAQLYELIHCRIFKRILLRFNMPAHECSCLQYKSGKNSGWVRKDISVVFRSGVFDRAYEITSFVRVLIVTPRACPLLIDSAAFSLPAQKALDHVPTGTLRMRKKFVA